MKLQTDRLILARRPDLVTVNKKREIAWIVPQLIPE